MALSSSGNWHRTFSAKRVGDCFSALIPHTTILIVIRAKAQWYPTELLYALRMIFTIKSVSTYKHHRCFTEAFSHHRPYLEWVIFIWNINDLRHARACPGYPGAVDACCVAVKNDSSGLGAYRRKDVVHPSGTVRRGFKPRQNVPERDTIPFRHFSPYGSNQACWQAPAPIKTVTSVALDCRDGARQ